MCSFKFKKSKLVDSLMNIKIESCQFLILLILIIKLVEKQCLKWSLIYTDLQWYKSQNLNLKTKLIKIFSFVEFLLLVSFWRFWVPTMNVWALLEYTVKNRNMTREVTKEIFTGTLKQMNKILNNSMVSKRLE